MIVRREAALGPRRKIYGKSSWLLVRAPSSTNVSKISFKTSSGRASGRSILLITTIGLQAVRECLSEHELGLRHRPFEGIDQDEAAVGHLQGPLDLAAEVGVTREYR